MKAREPFVSVVIPVRNGEALLPKCLLSLQEQDYPRDRFEIIIADGRSTDGTREIAKSYSAVVVDNPREREAPGRNIGLASSRGEIIAFGDHDCVMESSWLRNAVRYFEDDTVGGIGGPTLLPENETVFGRAVGFFFRLAVLLTGSVHREEVTDVHEVDDVPGCNAVYRRRALEAAMPVDEDLLTGVDVEMNFRIRRAGYRLLAVPDVRVRHYKRSSPKRLWRQMCGFAAGRVQVGLRDRRMIRIPHILAGLLLPLSAAILAAAILAGPRALGGLLLVSACLLAATGVLGWISSGDLAVGAWVPVVLVIGAAGWSYGFLWELLRSLWMGETERPEERENDPRARL